MTANITLNNQPLVFAPEDEADDLYAWDDHCYVCGRCTNHVGEHDHEVALGFVEYDGGDVLWTAAGRAFLRAWGPYGRRVIARAVWETYKATWDR